MMDVGRELEAGVAGDEFDGKVAEVDRMRVYAPCSGDGDDWKKEVGKELGGGKELGENPEVGEPRLIGESKAFCGRGGDSWSRATS